MGPCPMHMQMHMEMHMQVHMQVQMQVQMQVHLECMWIHTRIVARQSQPQIFPFLRNGAAGPRVRPRVSVMNFGARDWQPFGG